MTQRDTTPVREFIARFGGPSRFAKAIGVPQTTVSHWQKTGRIPAWNGPKVRAGAKAAGVPMPREVSRWLA